MTLLEPTLAASQLIVTANGRRVYDQKFRPGLNVIAGENGSGKSTVMEFLAFGLGAEPGEWREAAQRCDQVIVEVELNGELATLRRDVSAKQRRPMDIFWGPLEEAKDAAVEGWKRYPFNAYPDKASFTQALFEALELPRVRGEMEGQLTMHQLMRLVFTDQNTPPEKIFRHDQFDRMIRREAVGDFVCGVFDAELYEAEIELEEKRGMRKDIESRIASLNEAATISGDEDAMLNPGLVREEIENTEAKLDEHYEALEKLVGGVGEIEARGEKREREIAKELRRVKDEIRSCQGELEEIEYNISDSDEFIESLRRRLSALRDSETVAESLGELTFQYCPACFAELEKSDDNYCQLCKSEREEEVESPRFLRLRNELKQQLKESRELQDARKARREKVSGKLASLQEKKSQLQRKYNEIGQRVLTDEDSEAAEHYQQIGYLERQLDDLQDELRLANEIEKLRGKKSDLASEISELEDVLEAKRREREERQQDAYSAVSTITASVLREDLPRQDSFRDAEIVQFDFGKDEISVDGQSVFAASSNVYLRNAFHLALLLASLEKEYFRYPRLALFDGIEDKGMEPERSHNMQNLILQKSESYSVSHQIIITTAMLAPELDDTDVLVGEKLTHDNRSLGLEEV